MCVCSCELGTTLELVTHMPKKDKASKSAQKKEAAPVAEAAPSAWTCAECGQEHTDEDASAKECVACGHPKPQPEAAAGDDEDDKYKGIKVGLVREVEELDEKLKACTIDIGGADVSIVTNAANVAEGSRVVVATVGAVIQDIEVKKKSVGGRASEGMLCDGPALGWVGGGAGAAAVVPDRYAAGDRPPERRPRMDGK